MYLGVAVLNTPVNDKLIAAMEKDFAPKFRRIDLMSDRADSWGRFKTEGVH